MNLFINLIVYGLNKGMAKLMSDPTIISRQASLSMRDEKAMVLLEALGFPKINKGEGVKSIIEKIKNFLLDKKVAQKFEIKDVTDKSAILEIGDCIFGQACRMLRESEITPLCPLMGIIIGAIRSMSGKELTIKSNTYNKTKNTDLFEIEIGEY